MWALRRLQVLPSMVQIRQPRACYIPTKKLIKNNMKLLEEDKKLLRESVKHLPEFLEEMEGFEAEFGKDPREFHAERKRDEEQKRRFVKQKILEKKHFKPPQEVNLLTWDAKEQIRYLHYEFPDEWTLEKLADSFPISVDGLKRLLKSTYVPRDANDLYNHDLRVKTNWMALKDGVASGGGPLAVRYQDLVAEGKMRLLGNAAGNASLPMPEKKLLESGKALETEERKVGRFEAIVKDYVEQKKTAEHKNLLNSGVKIDVESDIVTQTDEIKKLIQTFVPADTKSSIVNHASMFRYLQDRTSSEQEKSHPKKLRRNVPDFKHAIRNEGKSDMQNNRSNERFGEKVMNRSNYSVHEVGEKRTGRQFASSAARFEEAPEKVMRRRPGSIDEFQMENSEAFSKNLTVENEFLLDDSFAGGGATHAIIGGKERIGGGRSLRRSRGRGSTRVRLEDMSSDDLFKYQMEGTKKISAQPFIDQENEIKLNTGNDISSDELDQLKQIKTGQFTKHARDSLQRPDSAIKSKMQYERHGKIQEQYLYSNEIGYQHPYGKVDDELGSVHISAKVKKPGRIFKKGNVYYDEDGEFLYRTP